MIDKSRLRTTAIICEILANINCLTAIEVLKCGPLTKGQLCNQCELTASQVDETVALLSKAGLVLREQSTDEEVALSPFGIYGAKTLFDQLFGGSCDGHCGQNCSLK